MAMKIPGNYVTSFSQSTDTLEWNYTMQYSYRGRNKPDSMNDEPQNVKYEFQETLSKVAKVA